jgi:membrane protease YdiL (CAAX protease family)
MKADDTGVRWWEPVVAFGGGQFVAILVISAIVVVAIARGLPETDAFALLTTNFMAIMGSVVLSDLVILGFAWGLVRRRTASPLDAYFPRVPVRTVMAAAVVGVVLSLLVNGGNALIDSTGWVHFADTPTDRALVPHSAVQFAVSVFTVSLLAPLVEEFVFRGLLLRWLLRYSRMAAVLVSSVVFGVIHGQFLQHPGAQGVLLTVELAATGVVLALLVTRTGSLRTSFATHAAFNLTATVLSLVLS